LDAVGDRVPAGTFDGTSFLGVLKGQKDHHRDLAYFMHNNVPEGPSYPIRGATDGRYHYIRNLRPDRIYIEKHLFAKTEHNSYMPSMFWTSGTNERNYRLLERYISRPAEALYDNHSDPHQMANLTSRPEFANIKSRLAKATDLWMQQQGDPGAEIDTVQAHQAARKQQHFKRQ
jgi:uncharacterized sulfatase